MAFDPVLAERVRECVRGRAGTTERRMFGGLAFLVDGRTFIGIRESSLMARIGLAHYDDALAMPGVRVMDFTGRTMKGYVYVDAPALARDEDLAAWVTWCLQHAAGLSPGGAPAARRSPKSANPR